MRARNVLCTLGVGALAMSVSAYAAPREAQTGKSPRPESSRLIAGQGGEIRTGIDNGTVANGTGARVRLTPVAVIPPSAGSVSGQTATLNGGPAIIKFDGFIGGWGAASNLTTFQIGLLGSSYASGTGTPLDRPHNVCTDPAPAISSPSCVAAYGAAGAPGDLRCANYFCPAGCLGVSAANECDNFWQETGRANWPGAAQGVAFNIPGCNSIGFACGSTSSVAPFAPDTGTEVYGMTFVLAADAGAAGTYSITVEQANVGGNFLQVADPNVEPFGFAKVTTAQVTIPTGSCCFDLGPASQCEDNVDQDTCNTTHVGTTIFRPGLSCAAQICAVCTQPGSTSDPACQDGDACTVDTCQNDLSACTHVVTPAIGANECCNPTNNVRTNNNDGDPCTLDLCSLPPDRGVAQNPPAPDGTACTEDPANLCTANDVCTGGLCAGTDVNGEVCVTDADCQHGGATPGAVCDGGACLCQLSPPVTIVLTHDTPDPTKDAACYTDNEKVTATVHVGPGAATIAGVQLAIVYDLSCLQFNSIQPAGPWTLNLMTRLGGTCAGGIHDGQSCATNCAPGGGTCVPANTIFYAAGIPLGGAGVTGNADAAVLSFTKKPGCVSCDICFSDNNPLHTYFSDDTGQAILVITSCSDEIRTKSPIDLDVPDTVSLNKGCDSNVCVVTWPAPSAGFGCNDGELVCSGIHLESGTVWDAGHVNGGGVFPGGNSNFCCTATNDCGNSVEKCWTVTCNDETSLEVEVQLSPTMDTKAGGGITRCIKFEVFNNCVQAPVVFEADLLFGGLLQLIGHFNGHIKIPAAVQPECITARDQHHTLRGCYTFGDGDCDANGVLHATFKGDPFFGGNWLIGGNLDGWKKSNPNASHDIIDILDFGSLVAEWLSSYDSDGDGEADGNTPCALYGDGAPGQNHADINGDGTVDLLDFSFIAQNFLDNSKDCCCPGSASLGNTVGRTEISVRELREQGMSDLTVADVNADGKVDMADMAALMQGARPNLKANDGGKDGSRSNNRK